jgi:CRP-like cAMP-binding protein
VIMKGGAKPAFRSFEAGDFVTRQGQPGEDVFLLLDGILGVEVDDRQIAQVGPGAIVGERALLEEGVRTASLRALTRCRVAVAQGDQLDPDKLGELSEDHRRELHSPDQFSARRDD